MESCNQELQMFTNQFNQEQQFLHSNSMREGQVEVENMLMTGGIRNLRLQFRNEPPQEIETGVDIKAKELTPIEVELVDASGQVVTSGPEAFETVEMVVLCPDDEGPRVNWTTEEFNKRIISSWGNNQKPLLVGETQFNLNEGIGTVGNIKFRHCKDWMKQSKFMLGARIVSKFTGVQIEEAKTEPFKIKDRRNGYYSKRDTLTMEDEIYRLKNISHKGTIRPCLEKEHIYTMKDFLHWLFKDPAKLKLISNLSQKKFEETIKHAQKGMINDRLCCYSDLDGKGMVVFDFVSQVLGVVFWGQYHHFLDLSDENKANAQKLAIHALQHWTDVVFFDNEAPLLQKFPLAFAFVGSMISSEEEHNIQKGDIASTSERSETFFGDLSHVLKNDSTAATLKRLEIELFPDDTSPPENHSSYSITAKMEEYRQVLIQDPNMATGRCSKPWVFMISIVIWKRVMLKKNTSTKREYPLPET